MSPSCLRAAPLASWRDSGAKIVPGDRRRETRFGLRGRPAERTGGGEWCPAGRPDTGAPGSCGVPLPAGGGSGFSTGSRFVLASVWTLPPVTPSGIAFDAQGDEPRTRGWDFQSPGLPASTGSLTAPPSTFPHASRGDTGSTVVQARARGEFHDHSAGGALNNPTEAERSRARCPAAASSGDVPSCLRSSFPAPA
jgi:hypothetical protein